MAKMDMNFPLVLKEKEKKILSFFKKLFNIFFVLFFFFFNNRFIFIINEIVHF